MKTDLSQESIEAALATLEALCREEYGQTLDEVRGGKDRDLVALKIERLTGILLKQHFADAEDRPTESYSQTGSKRIWIWDLERLETGVIGAEAEFELLDRLRGPGAWNEPWDWAEKTLDRTALTWEAFTVDVDSERGLFKVTALYLKDVLSKNETKSIAEYYRAKESETLKMGLDLTSTLSAPALDLLYAAVGVPGVAVGLALVLADFGASRLFSEDRHPDDWS